MPSEPVATRFHERVKLTAYPTREAGGVNPGRGYVRLALVANNAEVAEAAARIEQFNP